MLFPVRLPVLAACALVALPASLVADTVLLKDGGKVEGKIVSETDEQVTVDVKVSASISEQRILAKDQVLSIERKAPDELAFEPLAGLALPAESVDAAVQTAAIGKLRAFLSSYPESARKTEVEQKLAAFEEEKKRLDAGEMKLDGEWLSAAEVANNREEIDAKISSREMEKRAASGDLPGALNIFLHLKSGASDSAAYPDAVDFAKRILAVLANDAERKLAEIKIGQKEWEEKVRVHPADEQKGLRAARDRELAGFAAAVEDAKKRGQFPPLYPRSEKSLTAVKEAAAKLTQELASVDGAKMRAASEAARGVRDLIDRGDLAGAESALAVLGKSAKSGGALTKLAAELKAKQQAAKVAAKAKATPTPKTEEADGAQVGSVAKGKGGAGNSRDTATQKPFYATVPGALAILGGVLVVFGVVALAGKLLRKNRPT